jgi:hypothetical protein
MKILSLARMSLFAALLLASAISTTAAGDGVGTATLELENKTTGRKITSELWFEAAGDAEIEWFTPRLPLRPIPIARNAIPQPPFRKHPLIVISHGNWGTRFSQGWLALELVKSGYVVLSTSHPGTVGDDQTVSGRLRLWDRSRDVSFALDEVLRDPRWAELIDENRIGFVGHSFGGWTGVSLAGGRYDPARQRAFCDNAGRKTSIATQRSRMMSRACPPRMPETRSRMTGSRPSTSWVRDRDKVSHPTRSSRSASPLWWTPRNLTRSWTRCRTQPISPDRSRALERWCVRSGTSPTCPSAAGWSAQFSRNLQVFPSATTRKASIVPRYISRLRRMWLLSSRGILRGPNNFAEVNISSSEPLPG